MFVAISRWLAIRLDSLVFIMMVATSFGAVWLRDFLGPGEAGLSMVYVLTMAGFFQWAVRQSTEVGDRGPRRFSFGSASALPQWSRGLFFDSSFLFFSKGGKPNDEHRTYH